MAPIEYGVTRILGHSARQDAEGLHEMQYLVERDGADEEGQPHRPTWEDFLDVGIPCHSWYTHKVALGMPRLGRHAPDGYVYVYAQEDQEHVPRPFPAGIPAEAAPEKAAAPSAAVGIAKDVAAKKLATSTEKSETHTAKKLEVPAKMAAKPAADKTKKTGADKADDPKKPYSPRNPSGIKPRKGLAVPVKKRRST